MQYRATLDSSVSGDFLQRRGGDFPVLLHTKTEEESESKSTHYEICGSRRSIAED